MDDAKPLNILSLTILAFTFNSLTSDVHTLFHWVQCSGIYFPFDQGAPPPTFKYEPVRLTSVKVFIKPFEAPQRSVKIKN